MNEAKQILLNLRGDFSYYAPRCLKILTKKGRLEPFMPNEAQRYIEARLNKQLSLHGKVRALLLKGRQQGASTYLTGRYYWKTSGEFGKRAYL